MEKENVNLCKRLFFSFGNTSNTLVVIVLNGIHCLLCDLIELLLFELWQLIKIIFIFISVTRFAGQLIIQAKANFIDLVLFDLIAF